MPPTWNTLTSASLRSAHSRAQRTLAAQRLRAPATRANTARNARAQVGWHARWAPARDAVWKFVDRHLDDGMRVAIVGAGNGDTVPLARIAARTGELTLLDLDGPAIRSARRRQPRRLRHRIDVIEHDITDGTADAVATAAANAEVPAAPLVSEAPLPGAPYDLVIGDLLYSQLLYPALVDLNVPANRRAAILGRYGPMLCRAIVARLQTSAPYRRVLHIHDPIAWWPGHPVPVTLEQILATAQRDTQAALALVAQVSGPHHADPRRALATFAIPVRATAMWCWPFAPQVDYLVCATLTGPPIQG